MSEAEVKELYEQLRKLRGQLPEFLQTLTNLDDAQSSQDAFILVAQSLSTWTADSRTFVANYERLKASVGGPAKEKPQEAPEAPEMSFNDIDGGSLDTFGNEFFDLT